MSRHTLYAYVDGSDLHDLAAELESKFACFVNETNWHWGQPWVVNQKREDDPTLGIGDLPDWELGLNMDLPDPDKEPPGWFLDVEQIAAFLGMLHSETGRDFIIGIGDNERGISEDLFSVDRRDPDLGLLRRIIGVKEG